MEFKFTVRGDRITRENENSFVEGNKNSYTAIFDFGRQESWEGVAKLCVIKTGGGEVYRLPIIGNKCTLPLLEKGNFKIGVMGSEVYDGDIMGSEVYDGDIVEEGIVISTNMYRCEVESGAANEEANAELNSAAEVWMRYLSDMEENRRAAEEAAKEAKASADAAEESAKSATKVAKMTVSAESLPEGSNAKVTKTEDEDTLHLTFKIPKGEKGPKGDKGDIGENGNNGKTPVKGEDYFTDEDKEEMVNAVLNALPRAEGVLY